MGMKKEFPDKRFSSYKKYYILSKDDTLIFKEGDGELISRYFRRKMNFPVPPGVNKNSYLIRVGLCGSFFSSVLGFCLVCICIGFMQADTLCTCCPRLYEFTCASILCFLGVIDHLRFFTTIPHRSLSLGVGAGLIKIPHLGLNASVSRSACCIAMGLFLGQFLSNGVLLIVSTTRVDQKWFANTNQTT